MFVYNYQQDDKCQIQQKNFKHSIVVIHIKIRKTLWHVESRLTLYTNFLFNLWFECKYNI